MGAVDAAEPGFRVAFGEIDKLDGIPAPNRLEILPYVSARDTRAPGSPGDPFFKSNVDEVRRWAVTSGTGCRMVSRSPQR